MVHNVHIFSPNNRSFNSFLASLLSFLSCLSISALILFCSFCSSLRQHAIFIYLVSLVSPMISLLFSSLTALSVQVIHKSVAAQFTPLLCFGKCWCLSGYIFIGTVSCGCALTRWVAIFANVSMGEIDLRLVLACPWSLAFEACWSHLYPGLEAIQLWQWLWNGLVPVLCITLLIWQNGCRWRMRSGAASTLWVSWLGWACHCTALTLYYGNTSHIILT